MEKEPSSSTEYWVRLGPEFFREVWPLEPAAQSASTASNFVRIPAGVGVRYFGKVVAAVLPYLQPFEVWAVLTEFNLDPGAPKTAEIVQTFPEESLTLISVCIDEQQGHKVYGLEVILDKIVGAQPELQHDHRLRFLRRFAVGE